MQHRRVCMFSFLHVTTQSLSLGVRTSVCDICKQACMHTRSRRSVHTPRRHDYRPVVPQKRQLLKYQLTRHITIYLFTPLTGYHKQPLNRNHNHVSPSSSSTSISSSTMGNSFDSSSLGSTIAQIQEKLPSWVPFSHPPVYRYVSHNSPKQLVDFGQASLWLSVGMIFFNPIFWNFVARNGRSAMRRGG